MPHKRLRPRVRWPRASSRRAARRSICVLACCAAIGACDAGGPSADTAELANLRPWFEVPRSSPTAFVAVFDRFCVKGPHDMAKLDKKLRAAGYVPNPNPRDPSTRAYLVDDSRPAIAVTPNACLVRAKARTGQADRFDRYVQAQLPKARPVSPRSLGRRIEKAWLLDGPSPSVIGTIRSVDGGTHLYSAMLYRGQGI